MLQPDDPEHEMTMASEGSFSEEVQRLRESLQHTLQRKYMNLESQHDLWAAHIRKKHNGHAKNARLLRCWSRSSPSALKGSLREIQSILRRCQ